MFQCFVCSSACVCDRMSVKITKVPDYIAITNNEKAIFTIDQRVMCKFSIEILSHPFNSETCVTIVVF